MSEEKPAEKIEVIPKELTSEIRQIVKEQLQRARGIIGKVKEYEEIDNSQLLTLGIAFIIGLAFGVAITKKKE